LMSRYSVSLRVGRSAHAAETVFLVQTRVGGTGVVVATATFCSGEVLMSVLPSGRNDAQFRSINQL
jgi:hypothetical protein